MLGLLCRSTLASQSGDISVFKCNPPSCVACRHPQLIEAAGGSCVSGETRGKVTVLQLEHLAAADPDAIVFVPCGYDLERGTQEVMATPMLESEGV